MSENTAAGPDAEDERFKREAARRCKQVLDQVIASLGIQEPLGSVGLPLSEASLREQLGETVQKTLLGEPAQERLSTGQAFTAWRAAWLEAQDLPGLEDSETVKTSWATLAFGLAMIPLLAAFAAAVVTLIVGYIA